MTMLTSTWACPLLMFVFLLLSPPSPMFTFLPPALTPSIHFLSTTRKVSRSTLKVSSEHNQNSNSPPPLHFL